MARIPLTAKSQLEVARAYGHELSLVTRGEKTWVHCTCGYASTARRSRSAVNSTMTWHLSRAIADAIDSRNGMTRLPTNPGGG